MSSQRFLVSIISAVVLISMTLPLAKSQASDQIGQINNESELTGLPVFSNGVAAYVYGYPLVMFGLTERIAITVPSAGVKLGGAPLNQFGKEPGLPDSSFTDVVLPSTTTLYASAFINLKAEPIILHIPNITDRFFLLQMLDGWTNVSDKSPGSRLDSKEGDYALVGPDWTGTLPSGISPGNVIPMDTNSMWIIGRIYTKGTADDIALVRDQIYPTLTLTPLSGYHKHYKPPENLPLDPSVETVTSPLNQVAGMDACAFFGTLAAMMKYNPSLPADTALAQKLADIGILPNQSFDCTTLRSTQRTDLAALQLAVVAARARLQVPPGLPQAKTNFWLMPLDVGTYGTNYLLRAQVAVNAFGANNPIDAVYGYGTLDGRALPLNGSNSYAIHFKPKTAAGNAGEIPPVNPKSFWSVTIYNQDGTLVANNVVTYNAIGIPQVQGHSACFNPDNSLDLYLQPSAPSGGTPFCNWLPIPEGNPFIVFLRMYWPDNAVLSGHWVPPPIQRIR
jgi:hypothetical protein